MPAKGQVFSEAAIEKMKRSKADAMRLKYNWDLLDPYLDVQVANGARNRELSHITPRQFKEAILAGKSSTDLIGQGISKHLLKFLGNLAQGKVSLSKEEFTREYEGGASLDEIASKHQMPREDLTYLRELFGIKCKGAKFQTRKKTETLLTSHQLQILYGSLMGDAKRMSPSSAGFGHGTKQRDYLFWKYFAFENLTSPVKLRHTPYSGTTGNELHDWRFYTSANTDIERVMTSFYSSGSKQVTEEILEHLTPLSIAVWYQDDGNTAFTHQFSGGYAPECSLCTDSFTLESCEIIKRWFKARHRLDTIIVPRGKGS